MNGRFSIDAIFRAVDQLSDPVTRMQKKVESFSRVTDNGFKGLSKSADGIVAGVNKIAKATAAGAIAIGGGLALAAKPGMEFEQQMADLGATSLQTRDQLADLEKSAMRLGAATKFSATEVAAGMEQMAKAGFTNQEILSGIDGMVYAAAAAGEDLASTTEHVSSVMKGMGLATKDAAQVADVLALASVRTNSSITSLAESMANVSSTARQFKIPLTDTVAMVAMLQDVGLDASEAGSSLNTMLTKLAAPTDKVKEKMRALGITFEDAKHNMLSPQKLMAEIVKAGDKSKGNMAEVAFFADLVGLRGQKAALNLKELFKSGKLTGLVTELERAAGTAEKMSKFRMDTLTGDLDVMQENIKGIAIDLFSMNSGPLRKIAQDFNKWLDEHHAEIATELQEGIAGIAESLPVIVKHGAPLAKIVGTFYAMSLAVKGAQTAIDGYVMAGKLVGGVTGSIKALGVATGIYNDQLQLAGGGLAAMRARLNAGVLGDEIKDLGDLLGNAGLLGAAALVGYEFGTWINDVTGASDAIAKLVAQISGLEEKLRSGPSSLKGYKGEQGLAYGIFVDPLTDKITRLEQGDSKVAREYYKRHHQKWLERTGGHFDATEEEQYRTKVGEGGHKSLAPVLDSAFDFYATVPTSDVKHALQMISPQQRTARSVEESNTTNTEKVEITVKGETDRVQVKKSRGAKLKLQPTGTP
jgi:TP901 family phage tail tape measure protein